MTQNAVESAIQCAAFEDVVSLLEQSVDEFDFGAFKVFVTEGSPRKVVVVNAIDGDSSAIVSL